MPMPQSQRASRAARGYGRGHIAERKRWQRIINQRPVRCAKPESSRCVGVIARGSTDWDLGHDADRSGYLGPQCRACNRSAGGRNGAAKTNAQRRTAGNIFRDWLVG
jgi:hypothetical protein